MRRVLIRLILIILASAAIGAGLGLTYGVIRQNDYEDQLPPIGFEADQTLIEAAITVNRQVFNNQINAEYEWMPNTVFPNGDTLDGLCRERRYRKPIIFINARYKKGNINKLYGILIHEMAHAKVGNEHQHDEICRNECIKAANKMNISLQLVL